MIANVGGNEGRHRGLRRQDRQGAVDGDDRPGQLLVGDGGDVSVGPARRVSDAQCARRPRSGERRDCVPAELAGAGQRLGQRRHAPRRGRPDLRLGGIRSRRRRASRRWLEPGGALGIRRGAVESLRDERPSRRHPLRLPRPPGVRSEPARGRVAHRQGAMERRAVPRRHRHARRRAPADRSRAGRAAAGAGVARRRSSRSPARRCCRAPFAPTRRSPTASSIVRNDNTLVCLDLRESRARSRARRIRGRSLSWFSCSRDVGCRVRRGSPYRRPRSRPRRAHCSIAPSPSSREGRIDESVAAFDELARVAPAEAPHLWQRGIALYYAGRYEDCRAQFESHRTVNPDDVENAAWHFLCVARAESPRRRAPRCCRSGPTRACRCARSTRCSGATIGADAGAAGRRHRPQARFYAHLYVGLYSEATATTPRAPASISKPPPTSSSRTPAATCTWSQVFHLTRATNRASLT